MQRKALQEKIDAEIQEKEELESKLQTAQRKITSLANKLGQAQEQAKVAQEGGVELEGREQLPGLLVDVALVGEVLLPWQRGQVL